MQTERDIALSGCGYLLLFGIISFIVFIFVIVALVSAG